jgi:transcription elongation factor Elf1
MQKYKCKNEGCGYQGLLLTKEEFKKLHKTHPVKCPFCPATEQFDIEHTGGDEWGFIYECQSCNHSFASDEIEGIHERAKNNPDLYFDWFNDQRRQLDKDESPPSDDDDAETEETDDEVDTEEDDGDSRDNWDLRHFRN